jgi:hypothetical protein
MAGNEGEDGVHGGSPREKGRKVRETIKRARIRKRMTCQCRGRRGEPQNGDGFRRGRWRWPETLTEVSPEKFVVQTSALGLRGYEWRIQMWFSDLERAWLHRDIYSQIRKNRVIFIILEIPEIHFQFKNNSRKSRNRFKSLKNISKIPKIQGKLLGID